MPLIDELRKGLLDSDTVAAIIGMFEDREESIVDEATAFLSFATKNGNTNSTVRYEAQSPQRPFVPMFSVLQGFHLCEVLQEIPTGPVTKHLSSFLNFPSFMVSL
jgi:hypothetical protein